MPQSRRVEITDVHKFNGDFPEVKTYEFIDTELLYKGDDDPFYIVLPIARVNQVSANKIRYDATLVEELEQQLPELAGIRGHLTDEETATAFPIADVYWVGHLLKEGVLWAKGYIPVGENREDIRIRKATRKGLRTSVYVWAYEQFNPDGTTSLLEPEFDAVDLAPPKRASLKVGEGDFDLVHEMERNPEEGNNMPTELTKESVLADLKAGEVPDKVREQIIREAKVQADAAKVAEFQSEIAELRQYATIIGQVRTYVGQDITDEQLADKVREMQTTLTKLTETMGTSTDITVQVESYHMMVSELRKELGVEPEKVLSVVKELNTLVTEFRRKDFIGKVDDKVKEFTPWKVNKPENEQRLTVLRTQMRELMLIKFGGAFDESKIAEAATSVWETDGFKTIAEAVRDSLAGPSAFIPGQTPQPNGSERKFASKEEIAVAREATRI